MAIQLKLIEKQQFDVEKELTLRQYIQSLNLPIEKEHLPKSEYEKILKWLHKKHNQALTYIQDHKFFYNKIKEVFPKLADWENANFIKAGTRINTLYFWILALCGRVNVKWRHFSMGNPPDILSEQQKLRIDTCIQELHISSHTRNRIHHAILKIVILKQKEFEQINCADILECIHHGGVRKNGSPKLLFSVSTKLFGFTEDWKSATGWSRAKKQLPINLAPDMKDEYEYFQQNLAPVGAPGRLHGFFSFIIREYPEIEEYKDLLPEHLKAYALALRDKQPSLTDNTYNTYIRTIKSFLLFASKKKTLSKTLAVYLGGTTTTKTTQFYELYAQSPIILPAPVPQEDRELIEQLIYSYSPRNRYEYICISIIKLIYYTALRPAEARGLRLDCIRGTKEIPHLHVHRAKFYKERYIPLIPEIMFLIKELQEYNKGTLPYYDIWDGETVRRLFGIDGELIGIPAARNLFKKLLISGGLVNEDGDAKYSLYILRKIRITTWLETGMTDIEVAELAGHGDLETIKIYHVGKESRMSNAKTVYNTFYKDFIAEVAATGTYEKHKQIQEQDETEFIEKLKTSLLQIENKGINRFVIDEVLKQCPELIMPVPCGNCLAIALLGTEEICEKLKLPCLECEDLKVTDHHISVFDEFAKRLYKAVALNLKINIQGLAERNLALISRLKKFYIIRFGITSEEVEMRFLRLEPAAPRRGRRPKGV
ncbi:tyrosine-type recombinase/integrase [Pelosinus propionicus]|uniref:Phage integrase family protein n=1 Tax=Pelosinus propionicus DSM 13327 TaxID=1123291 RepID=A0A1I4PGJ1_9FIRM|nr:site-specific integrase [Pelosinus propionicus]SFM26838.1 Phage integrase family protein [Pelosinus propionicus DSM 13327]